MNRPTRPYVTPAIETLESSEILELVGPVQGYGPGTDSGAGSQSTRTKDVFPIDGAIHY